MVIKISGTEAVDCGIVYDLPHDIDIDIQNTKATRVGTVLKVRDNKEQFKEKLLAYLVDGTPIEVIDQFVKSLENLNIKDINSIELEISKSGIDKFLKSNIAGVVNFSSAIVTLFSSLPM